MDFAPEPVEIFNYAKAKDPDSVKSVRAWRQMDFASEPVEIFNYAKTKDFNRNLHYKIEGFSSKTESIDSADVCKRAFIMCCSTSK